MSTDPVVAFKTAIWFWMTASSPSCHAVMTGGWTPSAQDRDAGLLPGYGMTTYILYGGAESPECNRTSQAAQDGFGYYKTCCDSLRVGYGNNTFCQNDELAQPPSSSLHPPPPLSPQTPGG